MGSQRPDEVSGAYPVSALFEDRILDRADDEGASFRQQEASRFFYRWGGELASCLARVRERFQGDLDLYLIYLNFMLAELSQVVAHTDAVGRGNTPPEWSPRGMNALSLAEITGVPRETTRRKLQHLVEAGYLRRGDDGLFYLGGKPGLDFSIGGE